MIHRNATELAPLSDIESAGLPAPNLAEPTRVLIVDDEPTVRRVIAEVLTEDGREVTEATSGEQALALFRKTPFPIVMTDVVMGGMSGLELLNEIHCLEPDALVVLMTNQATLDSATAALRAGAYDFLVKPFDELGLISAVADRAHQKFRLLERNRALMEQLKHNAKALEEMNRILAEMASHDGLTELFNYRHFRKALDLELARSRRHGHPFALVFIDVDHFKAYNDAHGHPAGDEVLVTLAKLLLKSSRETSVCARYGGEEFVVLLPETDRGGAVRYANVVRMLVEEHFFKGETSQPLGRVTISAGAAAFPQDGTDGASLIEHADQALYRAKQGGRNIVRE